MLNTFIPARKLQKSYKSVINTVKTKKQAVVLTTGGEPQAAIVSLEDLQELEQAKTKQAALDMLELATEAREELKRLPSNLRKQADKILYG
ncbi:MAG: hypothetical protein UT54_C0072G0007 [Candidatus Daviesbacteria bacterium GW2011_GWB1_39_5]|uniref:Antitoxin n=1 Tax=Candidatus Daviesbacteria bacterium GW2011_GWC2_40_12 TaxID=1618431 RepID=A0A0G0QWR3_9BACT|nr:MAG: hypothetical protein UT45_C0005G0075 [Candidatus Daviesbacteria bacterium GW2011_GWA2_39_33]KKR22283.1 MAG: hypothetical protein UT54_C0072G0007 [Candidatus Daviesbacteria bacterium GW2011_GWB1_39_5]KKR41811.1 MAG: hypothetical protein UT77_C0006G0043 [Candidatus Daviesbacteria bacterium GW2011_GWC2_40_12]OGE21109.1 MAG: hypothetical protein A2778_02675 [Candidatus Daviesbacteria bacterium RIFCSPHIGHO2_01_FULL_40_24]OGE28951.1 MAG: hypothetical protein A3C29_06285 [Candidatus Daviesbact